MSSRILKTAAHASLVGVIGVLAAFVYRSLTVEGSTVLDDWPMYVGAWLVVTFVVIGATYVGIWAERFVEEDKSDGANDD